MLHTRLIRTKNTFLYLFSISRVDCCMGYNMCELFSDFLGDQHFKDFFMSKTYTVSMQLHHLKMKCCQILFSIIRT